MPVAFPVDSGRLAGLPNRKPPLRHAAIYKANAVQVGIRNADRVSRLNHVVLLVGCDDADRFLLNDTGAYPFLVATADQLYEARRYKDVACQQPGAPIFLPVTPPHVRLPLQVWCSRLRNKSRRAGFLLTGLSGLNHPLIPAR
jgi:hypothetical protein